MIKFLTIAVAVVFFVCGSVEAQLFRRFSRAQQQYAPRSSYTPYQSYSNQYQNSHSASSTHNTRYANGTYYRAQLVAPGRIVWVPIQPNKTIPQDIARKPASIKASPTTQAAKNVAPKLEVPHTIAATKDKKVHQSAVTQPSSQLYRQVTVYDPRTGRRSARLIPIPQTPLALQPYVYGQNRQSQSTTTQVQRSPASVTGTLIPPTRPLGAGPATVASGVQLDTQVSQATFAESSAAASKPNIAAPVPTVAIPRNKPARADGQFSVLDLGDDNDTSADDVRTLDLEAPAN